MAGKLQILGRLEWDPSIRPKPTRKWGHLWNFIVFHIKFKVDMTKKTAVCPCVHASEHKMPKIQFYYPHFMLVYKPPQA